MSIGRTHPGRRRRLVAVALRPLVLAALILAALMLAFLPESAAADPDPRPTPNRAEPNAAVAATASGPDLSTTLPRVMRDEITGDFLGLGYDQHARVENSSLNIYDPPARGGDLRKSTTTDLFTPNNPSVGSPMWANYGNESTDQCPGCFQALDAKYHLATVLLATDGRYIYLTGVRGTNVNYPVHPDDPDRYQNLLYAVAYGGSCAEQSCATAWVDLPSAWPYPDGGLRSVGATALAATIVGGQPLVAVGLTDYGVQIYTGVTPGGPDGGNLQLKSSLGGMDEDDISQSPATAMAFDSSGFLVVGVTHYTDLVYLAQVDSDGTATETAYWQRMGAPDGSGYWAGTPISAAIGKRPDGSKQVVIGMTDGYVYIPDLGGANNGTYLAISPNLAGGPVTITPIPRQDGSGVTDYAVAAQNGSDIGNGWGYFLTDNGAAALNPQVVGVDGSGNPSNLTADYDAFRSWFPGYKQGSFTLSNVLSDPISVTLHASDTSGAGCWFAPGWAGGSVEFPAGSTITVGPNQASARYTMGAYTAGSDGRCSGDPDQHPVSSWRGYLEITPQNRSAETRIVNLQLDPNGWTVRTNDQQGGSLGVTLQNQQGGSAFGSWQVVVGGPDAPAAVSSEGSPKLTPYQITPTGTPTTPAVYRIDVGPTSWSVPGLTASQQQVQALIPPLQVQGRSGGTAAWTNVGQLMPNGSLNVQGSQVTVPGASFYWENAAGGPTYTQFRVVTAGSNVLTSAVVDLTSLQFCYTGAKPGGPCTTPPALSSLGFTGPVVGQKVVANGLDQAQLATLIGLQAGGSLAGTDDAYTKVFYRLDSVTGPLVTNLYRQDICPSGCYDDYVGVQPSVGAYLNTGASPYGSRRGPVRGSSTANADYVSLTSLEPTQIVGEVRLTQQPQKTSPVTIQGYSLDAQLVAASSSTGITIRSGFGLTGCAGESNGSCVIAQTSAARAALYAQAPTDDTGLLVGALFANRAQNSVQDLPLVWTDQDAELLDAPAALASANSPTYLWKLQNSGALHSPQSDTWVVTHGQLEALTMCTSAATCADGQ